MNRSRISSRIALAAWLAAAAVAPAAPTDGPRPASAVVDAAGVLDAEDTARLERLVADVRESARGDLVIVLIRTTLGRPPRAFATDLFNRWEIGTAERKDGLLILVAVDDREAEIILGDGIDSPDKVAASERIMGEVMVPEFKRGRPAAAVRRAAIACAAEILGAVGEAPEADAAEPDAGQLPPAQWRQDRREPVSDGALPLALGGGGAAGGIGLAWYALRRHLRNRPRTCPHCGIQMERLGEVADDAHLADGERLEERLRSVDYDVWTCPSCPQVIKIRYGAFFTRYARCPKCRFATKSETVQRIRSPTTRSTGLEQIDERCAQCGYHARSNRVVPRLDDSSSSSGSSRGGGSSSGAGASGSW